MTLKCDWCGAEREKMTIWEHPDHGVLCLCFRGCQHFKEPRMEKTGLPFPQCMEEWKRVDPWQKKTEQPQLSKNQRKLG